MTKPSAPSPAAASLPAARRHLPPRAGEGIFRHGPTPRPICPRTKAGLRHYRREAKLTLAFAALKAGYSIRAIHCWEVGLHAPTPAAVADLAELYGVTVRDIVEFHPRREYRAVRVGPWETGRACESGWTFEEVEG